MSVADGALWRPLRAVWIGISAAIARPAATWLVIGAAAAIVMLPRLSSPSFGLLDDGLIPLMSSQPLPETAWRFDQHLGRFRPLYWLALVAQYRLWGPASARLLPGAHRGARRHRGPHRRERGARLARPMAGCSRAWPSCSPRRPSRITTRSARASPGSSSRWPSRCSCWCGRSTSPAAGRRAPGANLASSCGCLLVAFFWKETDGRHGDGERPLAGGQLGGATGGCRPRRIGSSSPTSLRVRVRRRAVGRPLAVGDLRGRGRHLLRPLCVGPGHALEGRASPSGVHRPGLPALADRRRGVGRAPDRRSRRRPARALARPWGRRVDRELDGRHAAVARDDRVLSSCPSRPAPRRSRASWAPGCCATAPGGRSGRSPGRRWPPAPCSPWSRCSTGPPTAASRSPSTRPTPICSTTSPRRRRGAAPCWSTCPRAASTSSRCASIWRGCAAGRTCAWARCTAPPPSTTRSSSTRSCASSPPRRCAWASPRATGLDAPRRSSGGVGPVGAPLRPGPRGAAGEHRARNSPVPSAARQWCARRRVLRIAAPGHRPAHVPVRLAGLCRRAADAACAGDARGGARPGRRPSQGGRRGVDPRVREAGGSPARPDRAGSTVRPVRDGVLRAEPGREHGRVRRVPARAAPCPAPSSASLWSAPPALPSAICRPAPTPSSSRWCARARRRPISPASAASSPSISARSRSCPPASGPFPRTSPPFIDLRPRSGSRMPPRACRCQSGRRCARPRSG